MREETAVLGAHAALLGPFSPTRQGGYEAADALVLDGATAAIAYNDLVAIGTSQHLQNLGIRLPQDCSLVGCDDIFGADLTVPALTTIGGPADKLGAYAVDIMHARLTGHEGPPSSTFEAHLVVRGSSGPAPDAATRGNSLPTREP